MFSQLSIDKAIALGEKYDPDEMHKNVKTTIGCDPTFGSSKFAIVVTQYIDGKIQVKYAEVFDRSDFQTMIDKIWEIQRKCEHISNIYVDSANPVVWSALKREFNEPDNIQYIQDTMRDCKQHNLRIENRMMVVPVPFSTEGARMLQHTKWILEDTF